MTVSVTSATAADRPTTAADDYTYAMRVTTPIEQVLQALTDEEVISRWWTVVTGTVRHGNEVQLFMGGAEPLVFTVDHSPGTCDVTWIVTDCAFLPDWVGTRPSFSVRANVDAGCDVRFRHVGLRPNLECFDQCRAGWNHFMPSLHRFLEVGEGLANEPRLTSPETEQGAG